MQKQGLSAYDAEVITASKAMAEYYDALIVAGTDAKAAANWLMGELSKHLNACSVDITNCPVSPTNLAEMIALIEKGTISGKIAKSVFETMWAERKPAAEIIKEQGLVQMSDAGELGGIVESVIAAHPQSVADFNAGKDKAIGFLVGQIMRQTKGRANPEMVNRILKEKLTGK
jgi:aspartyl-tRNA(Asn)/glutamyl-tRNA(Gln) amidotransferase subunit B